LKIGDVLFASISKEGQAYVIKEKPKNWNINESVFALRPNQRIINTDFFYYQLTCDGYYKDLLIEATGTTFKSVKQDMLRSSLMILPPLSEQLAIANYLDEKCSKIDKAIELVEKQIDAYKRLKRSLINEVVTGKRRVA
jgi:type I restriction enzyme S subunit